MPIGDLIALGKTSNDLVKAIKDRDVREKLSEVVLQLRSQISEVYDENSRLREENGNVRRRLDEDQGKKDLRDSVTLKNNAYVKTVEGQEVAHCIACLATRDHLVPLFIEAEDDNYYRVCPACKVHHP